MACTTDTTVPSLEILKELNPDLQKEWKRVLNEYYWQTCENFKKKHDILDSCMSPIRIEYTNVFSQIKGVYMVPFGVLEAGLVNRAPSLLSNMCPNKDTKEIEINLHITFDNGLQLTGLSADAIVATLRALGELEPKKEKPNE